MINQYSFANSVTISPRNRLENPKSREVTGVTSLCEAQGRTDTVPLQHIGFMGCQKGPLATNIATDTQRGPLLNNTSMGAVET